MPVVPSIIITGNICEGFSFIGPFASFEEADEFSRNLEDVYWIATLTDPKDL